MMMTRMMSEISVVSEDAWLRKTAAFLADYAALLSGCGATCIRIEKNMRRIAAAFAVGFDITIMPVHIYVSVWGRDMADMVVVARKVAVCGVSFNLNARLSRLSWEVADNHIDLDEAVRRFDRICETQPAGWRQVLFLVSLANASFCRLFGGDMVAMFIVLLSTLAGYRLKQIMLDNKRDVRLAFLCSAFFSASLSAGGHIFEVGSTPEIALGTSVLYLIPGVPYINAVSDMISRHYLCAFSRFWDALVLTVCLSAGLCAGMFLLGLKWF